ncbi:hypothetical protein [Demequina maris]|uniref:hypothetical protein n=1 Tax=Demequina maris TaxID=1638982 RepID=UPI0012E00A9D|nr:hypothetical protein [Demequina maris]
MMTFLVAMLVVAAALAAVIVAWGPRGRGRWRALGWVGAAVIAVPVVVFGLLALYAPR